MKLNEIPKKSTPFTPPSPEYFDDLPDRILARVQAEKEAVTPVRLYAKYGLRIAAVLTLLLLSVWVLRPSVSSETIAEEALAEVPEPTIQNYLLTESNLSHGELLEMAAEQGVPMQDLIALPENTEALEQEMLEWEELEDYL